MTTQSIKAQPASRFGTSYQSANVKGNSTDNSFELLMNNSIKQIRDINNQDVSTLDDTKSNGTSPTKDRVRSSDSKAKSQTFKQKADSKDVQTSTNDENVANVTAVDSEDISKDLLVTIEEDISQKVIQDITNDTTKDITKDSKFLKEIMELLGSIQQAAMDILNLKPVELQQLMEEQGMISADLLNPDMLQQLVLADSGQTAITAVLTDENLATSMKRLLQTAEELSTNSKLDLSEIQVKNILAQLSDQVGMDDNEPISEMAMQADLFHPVQNERKDVDIQKFRMDETNNNLDSNELVTPKENIAAETVAKDPMFSLANEESNELISEYEERQPEFEPADGFTQFVDQMVEATQRTLSTDASGDIAHQTEIREIANQIIEQIKVVVRRDQTSMELQLNPEHLGKVNLSLQSKDGAMTAQFVVENELTKEAIESQMFTLKNTLEQQGIKVENIEVTVANYSFEQSGQADTQKDHGQQGNTTSRKLTLEEAMQMNDLPQEDIDKVDITGIRGSQIDYTA